MNYTVQIHTSLAPGVTEEDLIAADNILGFKIPQTLRAMYRYQSTSKIRRDINEMNENYPIKHPSVGIHY